MDGPKRSDSVSEDFEPSSPAEEAIWYVARHPGASVVDVASAYDRTLWATLALLQRQEKRGHLESALVRMNRVFSVRFTPWERQFLHLASGKNAGGSDR